MATKRGLAWERALFGASLYVPYYIPPDNTYSYSWIWEPFQYRDAFTRELAKQLDAEGLAREFSVPGRLATQRAKPALWLFAYSQSTVSANNEAHTTRIRFRPRGLVDFLGCYATRSSRRLLWTKCRLDNRAVIR